MKNIAIISVLLLVSLFLSTHFFLKNRSSEDIIEKLEMERSILAAERDSLDAASDSIHREYERLTELDAKMSEEIRKKDLAIQELKNKSSNSQLNLEKNQKEMKETQEKINDLKKNPANRTGEDLLRSLREKTQNP